MTIRILVNGAFGKMGKITVNTLENHADFTLVGQTGRDDDLASQIKALKPDVVIDLTNAEAVWKNATSIIDAGVHPVIGTSGLKIDQVKQLQAECAKRKLGGIIAPNFSLGAVLLMKHAQEIAKYYSDIEIIEMHHDGKLDSPSGTALRTAEMISQTIKPSSTPKKDLRETVAGARGATYQNIPIHALRLPGLVAHEQVIFGGIGETLSIRHDSIDRISFMPGVCLASKKVIELTELVYGLEHIL